MLVSPFPRGDQREFSSSSGQMAQYRWDEYSYLGSSSGTCTIDYSHLRISDTYFRPFQESARDILCSTCQYSEIQESQSLIWSPGPDQLLGRVHELAQLPPWVDEFAQSFLWTQARRIPSALCLQFQCSSKQGAILQQILTIVSSWLFQQISGLFKTLQATNFYW